MKKRLSFAIILVLVLIFSNIQSSYSNNQNPQYVRIGLTRPVKYKDQVQLVSNGFNFGVWNNGFNTLFSVDDNSIRVRLDDNYFLNDGLIQLTSDMSKATIGAYHIELEGTYDSYTAVSQRVIELRSQNILAFPRYEGNFKIWIGQFISENEAISQRHIIEGKANAKGNIVNGYGNSMIVYDSSNNPILSFDKANSIFIEEKSSNSPSLITVENTKYRDYITFNRVDKELIVINYVSTNHYLYAVVPREVSPSWPTEALKAQAVAARNFALTSINRHRSLGYDLCDTTHCQVYGGHSAEHPNTNRAVDETANKVLRYNGQIITANYHSNSGGHTEDSENVWSNRIEYLRGVQDDFSLDAPNSTWTYVMDINEASQKLIANNINIGNVISMEPISFSPSGRVTQLMIRGANGDHVLEKEKTRQVFGSNLIKSTWFTVNTNSEGDAYVLGANSKEPQKKALGNIHVLTAKGATTINANSSSKITVSNGITQRDMSLMPGQFVFEGRGWGHGVGMSQWGAKKMAELGYNYKEILEYYYKGAKVE